MKRPLAIILCLSFILPGCAVGPDYERPMIETPSAWRISVKEAADSANTAWWEQFQDPALNDLVHTALLENNDVRIAAARMEQFMAQVQITRSGFYPQAGYGVAGSRDQASKNILPPGIESLSTTYQATLNVGWELDVWGRLRRATEAAQADLLAAEETRRTVILSLVSSVATGYITLRGLDAQLEIAKNTVKSRQDSLDLFELQFEGGVISELTLAQVRSEYEQAVAAVPEIQRQIAQTENALSVLLGRNPGLIRRGLPIDKLTLAMIPASIPSNVLERRPDIIRAEQNLIAANAHIGVARAEYFPSISLTGLAGVASGDLSDLFESDSFVWSIGGDALGAIFTGGRISAGVQQSEAYYRELLFRYRQAILTALREVEDALVTTQKAREKLQAQKRRIKALSDYASLARLRYDNGYASYIEVLDAERSLFDSELNAVRTQSEVIVGLINIYKAMGGGWVMLAEETANTVDFPPEEESQTKTN
ncbi:MAG: RND transporter [Desulfobacterales bacterium SG8_35]|nr:MAG: RND transporter [Desulfobacterales bacterium SG8_35]